MEDFKIRVSREQAQMNRRAFTYATLTSLLGQTLCSTVPGEVLISVSHTVLFTALYFPCDSDHT